MEGFAIGKVRDESGSFKKRGESEFCCCKWGNRVQLQGFSVLALLNKGFDAGVKQGWGKMGAFIIRKLA